MKQLFSFKSLVEHDGGRVRETVDLILRRLAEDCDDRPGVNEARKCTLQINMTPVMDVQSGDLDTIKICFGFKESIPARSTKVYDLEFRKGGRLLFNDMSDDNVHQHTIDEEIARHGLSGKEAASGS